MSNGLHRVTLTRHWLRRCNCNPLKRRAFETVRFRNRIRRTSNNTNNFLNLVYTMWQIITYIIGTIIYYICMLVCTTFGGPKAAYAYTYSYPYSC